MNAKNILIDGMSHFDDFANFADGFLAIFNFIKLKSFGPVSKELKNVLIPMGFHFCERVGSL